MDLDGFIGVNAAVICATAGMEGYPWLELDFVGGVVTKLVEIVGMVGYLVGMALVVYFFEECFFIAIKAGES